MYLQDLERSDDGWAELDISNCFKIIVALGRDRGFGKPEDVVHTSPLKGSVESM
jgi:hypothetical protein